MIFLNVINREEKGEDIYNKEMMSYFKFISKKLQVLYLPKQSLWKLRPKIQILLLTLFSPTLFMFLFFPYIILFLTLL